MANRHQFRAHWHDYNEGIYFVTICCAHKLHYFGNIFDKKMMFSEIGKIACEVIDEIPRHIDNVEVWNYVVMPNHIHMVLAVGTRHGASAQEGVNDSRSLPKN